MSLRKSRSGRQRRMKTSFSQRGKRMLEQHDSDFIRIMQELRAMPRLKVPSQKSTIMTVIRRGGYLDEEVPGYVLSNSSQLHQMVRNKASQKIKQRRRHQSNNHAYNPGHQYPRNDRNNLQKFKKLGKNSSDHILGSIDLLSGGVKTPYRGGLYGGKLPPNNAFTRKEIIIEGPRLGYEDSELADGELCDYIVKKEEISLSEYRRTTSRRRNKKLPKVRNDSLEALNEKIKHKQTNQRNYNKKFQNQAIQTSKSKDLNHQVNIRTGTYSNLPIYERNLARTGNRPTMRSRDTLKTKKSDLKDSKSYLVILKNGARIPMNRNEYIAYQIALAQVNPSMLNKSHRRSPSKQSMISDIISKSHVLQNNDPVLKEINHQRYHAELAEEHNQSSRRRSYKKEQKSVRSQTDKSSRDLDNPIKNFAKKDYKRSRTKSSHKSFRTTHRSNKSFYNPDIDSEPKLEFQNFSRNPVKPDNIEISLESQQVPVRNPVVKNKPSVLRNFSMANKINQNPAYYRKDDLSHTNPEKDLDFKQLNLEKQKMKHGDQPRSEYPIYQYERDSSYRTGSPPRLPYDADKSIYDKNISHRTRIRRKLKAAFYAVYFYQLFKNNLKTILEKKKKNSFDYYNKHLSNIFKSITNFTLEAVNPAIIEISKVEYKLDFRPHSGLDNESKTSNYYQAVDLAIDVLVTIIEETMSHMDKNEFITFLCKKFPFFKIRVLTLCQHTVASRIAIILKTSLLIKKRKKLFFQGGEV